MLLVFSYILLFLTVIATVIRWKELRNTDRIIGFFILLAGFGELASYFLIKFVGSNYFFSHIYSPIELFVLCFYFNQSILSFRKRNLGIYIGIVGIIVSLIDSIFFQNPFTSLNSYFLLFEASVIIVLCLISFFQILMDEERMPYNFAHFWITIGLLFFWCSTFTGWGLFSLLGRSEALSLFTMLLRCIQWILYGALLLVLIRYKKLIPSGAE